MKGYGVIILIVFKNKMYNFNRHMGICFCHFCEIKSSLAELLGCHSCSLGAHCICLLAQALGMRMVGATLLFLSVFPSVQDPFFSRAGVIPCSRTSLGMSQSVLLFYQE